ncbi:MAG: serine/threonine protein kinase [Myxococcota bacterium]|jgi:serine/threonine protein kinase
MLTAGTQLGSYIIEGQLAEGGMARIFRARHYILRSEHAVKVLHAHLAQHKEIRQRFLDEGRIQARLRHPNITPVTDVVIGDGIAGLVMPLMQGEDLEERLEREGPLSLSMAAGWIGQILSALAYIHENNIVHRDLKPANIFLERLPDGDNEIRLLDFGIAKVQDTGRTRTGFGTMGSLAYMSPEQLNDPKDVDPRSDLFVVGMLLYEMLAGRSPFQGKNDFETQMHIVQGTYAPIRSVRPGLPPEVEPLIARAIAKAPEKRFRSAARFARAVKELMRITAAPPATSTPTPTLTPAPKPKPKRAGPSQFRASRPTVVQLGQCRLELTSIPAGAFWRGEDGSSPTQRVEVTQRLLVSRTPIDQGVWEAIMGDTPGQLRGRTYPVTDVSWYDGVRFCNALSAKDGLPPAYILSEGRTPLVRWDRTSPGYRLLTEAEWEHAARAGQETMYAGSDKALEAGWFKENSARAITPTSTPGRRRSVSREEGSSHPMTRKVVNAWGLYDASGNVWEWVWDHGAPFPAGDQLDPIGPSQGTTRVCRGGSWRSKAADAPLSTRLGAVPMEAADDRGFRIARHDPDPD